MPRGNDELNKIGVMISLKKINGSLVPNIISAKEGNMFKGFPRPMAYNTKTKALKTYMEEMILG